MAKEINTIEDVIAGDSAFFEHTITVDDLAKFADVSGDHNPLHMDDAYAKQSPFKGRVVHGMFLGSLVSRFIGMYLPGKKALLVKESLEFRKPAHIGDLIKISGVVTLVSKATGLMNVEIKISRGADILVTGDASVKLLN